MKGPARLPMQPLCSTVLQTEQGAHDCMIRHMQMQRATLHV